MSLSARGRRWIRRIVYTLLGIPAAAALILLIYIYTGHPDQMAKERLVAALEGFLGRPVTIRSVELRYLPPGLIVTGFRTENPLMEAERMEVAVSLRALLAGRLVIRDVDLYEPLIEWKLDTERFLTRESAGPATPPGEGRFSSRVDLRRVRLHRARVLIGSEIRELSAQMDDLRLHADNQETGLRGPWAGAVVFSRGRFLVGDLQIDGAAGSFAFEADPASIRTRRLTVKAEGVDIRATGQMQPGSPVRGRFEADARLDPAAPSVRRPLPQIDAKNFTARLTLTLPGDGVRIAGTFTADAPSFDADRGFGPDGRVVDGPEPGWLGTRGEGTFQAENGRIEVRASIAGFSGGSLEATYVGAKPADSDQAPRRHQLNLSARRLDLPDLLRHFELPGRPDVTPSALVSGEAQLGWEQDASDRMRGSAELIFDRAEGTLPVWGAATVSWLGRRVTIEASSLTTDGSAVTLNGTVDGAAASKALSLTARLVSTDTAPLAAFLESRFPSLGAARLSPSDLGGGIETDMTIGGTTARPVVEAGFATTGALVTLPTASLAVTSATGSLAWRHDLMTLTLTRLEGKDLSAHGSLSTNPQTGEVIAVNLEAAAVSADLLARLSGADADKLAATGTLHGTAVYDRGDGQFHLAGDALGIGKLQFSGFEAGAHMKDRRLRLDEATAIFCGGKVSANGLVDFDRVKPSGAFDFTVTAVDLAKVDEAYPGPAMTGSLDATGRLTVGEATRLEAKLTASDTHIAGTDLGRLTGVITGLVNSAAEPLRLDLTDDTGGITMLAELSGEALVSGQVRVRAFSLEEVRPLLPPDALRGLAGEVDGVISFNGPLIDPRSMILVALLDRVSLTAGDTPLTNDAPVRLTLQDGFLTLAPMRLTGGRTDLTVGGSMTLSGTYDITARVAGTYDLALAELLFPEMSATGNGTADLKVTERGDVLSYGGTITLDTGTIRHPSLPLPLENLRGRGEFSERGSLNITSLLFDTGGGNVSGSGFVRFEGARVPEIHLALTGKGVRAEIFPEMRAFFDAEVTLDKDGSIYRLGGQVLIQRAIYTRAFGVAPSDLLLRGREFAPARESPPGAGTPPQMLLSLDIDAEHDVWIRNDDALIEASAHLRLEGTLNEPELSGRVSALEGGTYRFRDVTYRIVGGSIDFADLTRIDPLIEIEAATRVQLYEITLRITGRYSRPTFELTSDPPLPQRDVVWLLLTGHTIAEESSDAATLAAEGQVAAYLASPVAGAVTAPLGRLLGVSSFQIDPFLLNGSADPSARVTVTKRLEQGLQFTYSNSLGQSGQEIYQIEYNPGRIWDLIATRDLDGSIGADLRFRRRWKGFDKPPPLTEGDVALIELPASRRRVGTVAIVADHLADSLGSLIRKLPFDEGDLLRRGDLLEGRERLRLHYVKRGYPAAKVDLVEQEAGTPERPVTNVSFAIRAGALHELEVHSDVQKRGIRSAVLKAWQEPILLEDLASEAGKSALALLKDKGYYTAKVDVATGAGTTAVPPEQTPTRVTLDVTEGEKVRVRSIAITGNSAMPEERIRRQLLTREGGWLRLFGRGLLKEAVLKEDVDAVRGLYLAHGYLNVKLAEPRVTLSGDGDEAEIGIQITEEGPQSRIGDIVLEGEAPGVPGEKLIMATGLSRTQVLTAAAISAAADKVREKLDEEGYSHARVSTSLSGPAGETRVVFSIVPLERARVREVAVIGNTRTRSRIVQREITVNHGDYLSRAALLTTQRNLYRLGVFRSVQMETIPVEGRPGFVDVRISVQEGSPILTAWGIGYDTEDLLRGTFEIANNNLFGTRRSATLFVRESSRDRRVQVTLRDPNLFGEKIESLLSGFHEREESESFDLRRLGASTQVSRKLGEHIRIFGRYLLEDINLFNVEVSEDEIDKSTVRLASLGVSMAHDTRNDIINPTRGGLTSVDYRVYHHGLWSEAQFSRLFASTTHFKDLGRGVVWASSVRMGVITSDNIPISERFFAGGDTTLRGFPFNHAGPLEPANRILADPNLPFNPCKAACDPNLPPNPIVGYSTDNLKPVGGNAIFLLNQELRFPLVKALKGVIFYDAGNVYSTYRDFDVTYLRNVLGVGLRFDTPVGPFRIEYGRKLDHDLVYNEDGEVVGRRPESRGEFFFSIGQAF